MTTASPPVDFIPTEEQDALREAIASLLGRSVPAPVYGKVATVDRTQLQALGGQLGVLGLDVPEEHGGPGGTLADSVVLNVEAGRALSSLPLATYSAVSWLLAAAGDDLLEPSLTGSALVGLAGLPEPTAITASPSGDRVTLDGPCAASLGSEVDGLLVIARSADGLVVVAVDEPAAARLQNRVASLDLSRPWTSYHFDATPGRILDVGPSVVQEALGRAMVATAADQVGICLQSVDDAIAYAKIRYQFGRSIGSRQAIKHRLVDMSLATERATAAVEYAAGSFEQGSEAAIPLAALETATSAALEVTAGAIQVFGGIGMTWEHRAHLYLRRALSNQVLFGPPTVLRRRLAQALWPRSGSRSAQ
jgi:alkylation response protein AidB-like acyl-CoA dehydrogenase